MKYDFDRLADKTGLSTLNEAWRSPAMKEKGIIGFDLGEADFATAPCIVRGLTEFVQRGVFNFTINGDKLRTATQWWMETQRDWEIEKEWLVSAQGVIFAGTSVLRMCCRPGEGYISSTPVYYRVEEDALRIGRKVVHNPLKLVDGRYRMDFEDLETKMADPNNKFYMLCNPHNPIGRVWQREELAKLAALANKYGIIVYSDEIYAENVYNGNYVTPYAKIPGAERHCIIGTSIGKAFSVTGINFGNIVIPDPELRKRFVQQRNRDHYGSINPFTHAAFLAAYTEEGADWLREMNSYVEGNMEFIKAEFRKCLPEVHVFDTQGGYTVWIDMRPLGLAEDDLHRFLRDEGLFAVSKGSEFGPEGDGFIRMSVACPRAEIAKALDCLWEACRKRGYTR